MIPRLRTLLLVEAIAFALAAMVHFGVLVHGYEHDKARIAESIIALALLAGLAVSLLRPALTRDAALAAQGFALLGTFVGLFTIIIGVGPRTVPDVIFHILIIVLLILGLLLASQTSGAAGSPAAGRSIHHGGNV